MRADVCVCYLGHEVSNSNSGQVEAQLTGIVMVLASWSDSEVLWRPTEVSLADRMPSLKVTHVSLVGTESGNRLEMWCIESNWATEQYMWITLCKCV